MADYPLEKAIQHLKETVRGRKDVSEDALKKIQELTVELAKGTGRAAQFNHPIDQIDRGFRNFKINQFEKYPWFYEQLAKDQSPDFLVFACSDSRVSPTFIFDFFPGKAFVTRNIANLVPPFDKHKFSGVGAVIEYAVNALKVKAILVIGHSRCGGIKRLMTMDDHPDEHNDFIDDWVKIATPAKNHVNRNFPNENIEQKRARCEKEAVILSLRNLESYPYVKQAEEEKKVMILGGYYDFVSAKLLVWPKGYSSYPLIEIPKPPGQDTQYDNPALGNVQVPLGPIQVPLGPPGPSPIMPPGVGFVRPPVLGKRMPGVDNPALGNVMPLTKPLYPGIMLRSDTQYDNPPALGNVMPVLPNPQFPGIMPRSDTQYDNPPAP